MTIDPAIRSRAMKYLARGLITIQEAATLTGASRQLVRHWCLRDGLDVNKARAQFLRKLWRGR